jgi:CheY-like chemotaxis protein
MSALRVFVSHSSEDNAFSSPLADGLQHAGADVWYDQENLHTGQLHTTIGNELNARPVFIVILSQAAFNSGWVKSECGWAYNLYTRKPDRVILPVTASRIDMNNFDEMLWLEDFKRIEGPHGSPLAPRDALTDTIRALGMEQPVHPRQTNGPKSVLWVDDIPSNNFYVRRPLENMGVSITVSKSTDDALGKLFRYDYDAVISDMSRPDDSVAGYTLLEQTQRMGKRMPFILFTGSQRPEHVADARRRGAFGQTSMASELIELVIQALNIA